MIDKDSDLLKYIVFPFVAALGGIVNYSRKAYNAGKFSRVEFAIEGTSAIFIGVMVTLICSATGVSNEWAGAYAGMSGWMGADFARATFTSLAAKVLDQPINYSESIDKNYKGRNDD